MSPYHTLSSAKYVTVAAHSLSAILLSTGLATSSSDASAPSLPNDVDGPAPPLGGALFTIISRLLARRVHDRNHTAFISTDTGQSTIHQPNRPWDSRVVGVFVFAERCYTVYRHMTSLIIVVVGWFFVKGVSPNRGEVVLGRFGKNTLSTFPVQVFAYT